MSTEQTQLSQDSDTVHEEGNYMEEHHRTHGQPESQRDPTLFKNTDQDNLVDTSTIDTNIGTTDIITQELSKLSTAADVTDNHFPPKSEEDTGKPKKTANHNPTRRKSLTNQTHSDTKNQSNTQGKTVHHSPTRRKSITNDTHKDTSAHSNAHGKNTNHSPTRRKSITHDTSKDTATHLNTREKTTTNNPSTDTHKKPGHHSPTRRKSITHDAKKDVSYHSNAHSTRRKSNAHEHEKDQSNKSEKAENGDLITAHTEVPTQTVTNASSADNQQTP